MDETTLISFPFVMDEEERLFRLRDAKIGNIKLIGDFYLRDAISINVIKDCWGRLRAKETDQSLRILCALITKVCKKLYFEDLNLLDNMFYYIIQVKFLNNIGSLTQ